MVADNNAVTLLENVRYGAAGNVNMTITAGARRSTRSLPPHPEAQSLERGRRSSVLGCDSDLGPFPLGDVNSDCTFDLMDAFLTAQYMLVSMDGYGGGACVSRLSKIAWPVTTLLYERLFDSSSN